MFYDADGMMLVIVKRCLEQVRTERISAAELIAMMAADYPHDVARASQNHSREPDRWLWPLVHRYQMQYGQLVQEPRRVIEVEGWSSLAAATCTVPEDCAALSAMVGLCLERLDREWVSVTYLADTMARQYPSEVTRVVHSHLGDPCRWLRPVVLAYARRTRSESTTHTRCTAVTGWTRSGNVYCDVDCRDACGGAPPPVLAGTGSATTAMATSVDAPHEELGVAMVALFMAFSGLIPVTIADNVEYHALGLILAALSFLCTCVAAIHTLLSLRIKKRERGVTWSSPRMVCYFLLWLYIPATVVLAWGFFLYTMAITYP